MRYSVWLRNALEVKMIYDVMLGLTLLGFGSYGLRWLARETWEAEEALNARDK